MKLEAPFIKLPFRFDAARLQEEVAALPAEAWVRQLSKIHDSPWPMWTTSSPQKNWTSGVVTIGMCSRTRWNQW